MRKSLEQIGRILAVCMLIWAVAGIASAQDPTPAAKKGKGRRPKANATATSGTQKARAGKKAPAAPTKLTSIFEETKEQRDARMQWWREARFGMFVHWGVYSVPGGIYKGAKNSHIAEWSMLDFRIPVAEYADYAKQFNPVKFDADKFVKTAKDAGMKYIVITSKHHDGFAMFKSAASPWNIYDATPFKRDPLKELAEACKKQGMKLGFYYSQAQDWHNPGGAAAGGKKIQVGGNQPAPDSQEALKTGSHWDKAQDGSMDEYIDKVALPQVKEILSNYGDVAVLWFDTPVGMTPERSAKFVEVLKQHPTLIVNNRLRSDKGLGDNFTPEQTIPATGLPGDWETCMTMNGTWGFKSYDNNWKSVEDLQTKLVDIASKGGNFLLNVGPTPEGEIPAASVERLETIGKWMKVNGESIYGTTASPFDAQPAWGRFTKKEAADSSTLYAHVEQWPADGKLAVPAIAGKVSAAKLVANGEKVEFTQNADGVTLTLPKTAPDAIDSVVKIEIQGKIK